MIRMCYNSKKTRCLCIHIRRNRNETYQNIKYSDIESYSEKKVDAENVRHLVSQHVRHPVQVGNQVCEHKKIRKLNIRHEGSGRGRCLTCVMQKYKI